MKNNNFKVIGYFDGACAQINPFGHIGTGGYINYDGEDIFTHTGYVPASKKTSNNLAEYLALKELLEFLIRECMNHEEIIINGDSKLVINQMQGFWKIKNGFYVETALLCQKYLEDFPFIRLNWIPRELNTKADELSNVELIKRGIKMFEPKNESVLH